MSPGVVAENIHYSPAPPHDRRSGLLGYIDFDTGGLRISGVTLRRTRRGKLTLSFPVKHDRAGRQHALVRPVDAHARAEIEWAVLDAIGPLDAQAGATGGHGGRTQ